nr:MAG TPA: hypothetical protein [Caudoviricetes sp.]
MGVDFKPGNSVYQKQREIKRIGGVNICRM